MVKVNSNLFIHKYTNNYPQIHHKSSFSNTGKDENHHCKYLSAPSSEVFCVAFLYLNLIAIFLVPLSPNRLVFQLFEGLDILPVWQNGKVVCRQVLNLRAVQRHVINLVNP